MNKAHDQRIEVLIVEAHSIAFAPFVNEARTLVQTNRGSVVFTNLKLHASDAIPLCVGNGSYQ